MCTNRICLKFVYLFIGKQPENPNVKQKVMFWKAYRSYIKREIARLRQAAVSLFRQLFFKGKYGGYKYILISICSYIDLIWFSNP